MSKNASRNLDRPSRRAWLKLIVLATLCGSHNSVAAADAPENSLHEARAALIESYADKLKELAVVCRQNERAGVAERLETWLPRRALQQAFLFTRAHLSRKSLPAAVNDELHQQFLDLRKAQADALFELAGRAARESRTSLAMQLAFETVRENPGHAEARKILGFEPAGGRWWTADEIRRIRAGNIWHKRFGWLDKAHVARFENGERHFNGRWITAEQDAQLHRDIARGWTVETEHYEVTTNHSLEAAVELADRLEKFHDVWWQLFAGYHLTDRELERLFERGITPRRPTRRHKVVFFRDRPQYVEALARMQPGIEATLGIYFGDVRVAYFFAGEEQDSGTLFHEATHQLFQEARPTKSVIALDDNFWIVEGIACYMESLQLTEAAALVGGLEHGRVPTARVRLLGDGFYVPFAEMVTYGSRQVQRDSRIRTLYSQFAGQATFLMHDESGRRRDAVAAYLTEVYRGSASSKTLAQQIRVGYAQLDQQYRKFLQAAEAAGANTDR